MEESRGIKVRILLVALNARYVHTNLAVRCLGAALEEQGGADWDVVIKEYSINDQPENIAGEIFEEKPDLIGFSCYIWNIAQMKVLIRRLRPVLPQTYFVFGGPEVSFEPEELLTDYPQLDAVILGEGEVTFPLLVQAWDQGLLPWEVPGLVWHFRKPLEHRDLSAIIPSSFKGQYRDQEKSMIFTNEPCTSLPDLNKLSNPYAGTEDFHGRLVYVETSRGCPFSCQFCISSTFQGVRYLEPERFRLVLSKLFDSGARTIKFVDRTFNARKKHAFQILDVFREEAEKISTPRAHCEMAGELLDEEWMEYLKNYPKGLLQLEIGVQSTHQPTLEAVQRPQNFEHWKDKVRFLQQDCNIPIHLDLIAGLPLEGWREFRISFNEVFAVRPSNLQLGFLKILKGSGIWKRSEEYEVIYSPDPPYSVLSTGNLSHQEILELVKIEEILEKYYNSGRFKYSLECILTYISKVSLSPFELFHSFAQYWQKNGWFKREWDPKALFQNIWEYFNEECRGVQDPKARNTGREERLYKKSIVDFTFLNEFQEALRFDYYLLGRPGTVPEFLAAEHHLQDYSSRKEFDQKKEEIKRSSYWLEVIPEAQHLDKRQWSRATAVDYFLLDVGEEGDGGGFAQGAWYLFYYGRDEKRFFRFKDLISN